MLSRMANELLFKGASTKQGEKLGSEIDVMYTDFEKAFDRIDTTAKAL